MSDGFDKLFEIAEEEKLTGAGAEGSAGAEGEQKPGGEEGAASSDDNQNQNQNSDGGDEGDEGSDDASIIAQFKELTGYEGEVKDLSVEGIAAVVSEIKTNIANQYSVYDTNPQIKAVAEWISKGGKLEDFMQVPTTFDKTVYKEDNPVHVESILKTYYKDLKNLSDEEVQEQLDFLAATPDKQKVRFTAALDAIEQHSNNKYNAYVEKVQADQAQAVEDGKKLEASIASGKFQGISLGKEEVTSFSTYLKNQEEYDAKWKAFESDPNKVALIEYLVYHDCDLNKLKGFTPIQSRQTDRRTPNLIKVSGGQQKTTKEMSEDEALDALNSIKIN